MRKRDLAKSGGSLEMKKPGKSEGVVGIVVPGICDTEPP